MEVNGKQLKVTVSSFSETMELMKVLSDSMKEGGITFSLSGFKFEGDIEIGDIGPVVEAALSVATSSEVREALFKCAKRALIGDNKVDKDFFENPDNRQYYFPVMIEIARVNLAPFFGILNSWSASLSGLKDLFQKSESQQA